MNSATRRLQHLSQFDYTQVIKNAHDEWGNALRVSRANSEVPSNFSDVTFTRDVNGSITAATFFRGASAEQTQIVALNDVGGSLGGKYFLLNSPSDTVKFYVWYDTGSSVDPAIPGRVGIRINILPNDNASIVAMATKLTLEKIPDYFRIIHYIGNTLTIENAELGDATNSTDGDTGFNITTLQEGITARVKTFTLEQDPNVKIVFNYGENVFEVIPISQQITIIGTTVSQGTIQNIPALVAGTEYSFTMPANTRRFEFKCRGIAKLQFAFVSGGSASNFRTVSPGASYKEEGLVLSAPITIYFQTTKDSETLELTTWS